jgi:hypothetical protein
VLRLGTGGRRERGCCEADCRHNDPERHRESTHLVLHSSKRPGLLETSPDEAERFELAAERAGAEYVEIALSVDPRHRLR